eukprot:g470.t1
MDLENSLYDDNDDLGSDMHDDFYADRMALSDSYDAEFGHSESFDHSRDSEIAQRELEQMDNTSGFNVSDIFGDEVPKKSKRGKKVRRSLTDIKAEAKRRSTERAAQQSAPKM